MVPVIIHKLSDGIVTIEKRVKLIVCISGAMIGCAVWGVLFYTLLFIFAKYTRIEYYDLQWKGMKREMNMDAHS